MCLKESEKSGDQVERGRLNVEKMQREEGTSTKCLRGRGNGARRKKERAGKTSERKLLRRELQTEGGVQRRDPGD